MKQHHSLTMEERIQEKLKQNMSYVDIVSDLHVSPKRIVRVQKLLSNSIQQIMPLPMGRPPIVNKSILDQVDSLTLQFPKIGGKHLAYCISQKLGVSISKTTINKIREILHFRFQSPRKQPFLTEEQMVKRVEFAKNQLNGPIDWSSNVILSDESRFGLEDDSQRIWVKRGVYNKESFRQKRKFAKSIMVWGAISKGWRSPLVVITGNLNTNGYIDLLNDNKIFQQLDEYYGNKQYYFEQDGAPPHRSKISVKWIEERANLIQQWPPNSPDLSGIENLWAILKQRISNYHFQTISELKEQLQREWSAIPQETIDSIIASTPQRFQLVVNENGKSIGHMLHRASIKKSAETKINAPAPSENEKIVHPEERMCIHEILGIQFKANPPVAFVKYNNKSNAPELITIDELKKIAPQQYVEYLESLVVCST
jgi:hypothetical protein